MKQIIIAIVFVATSIGAFAQSTRTGTFKNVRPSGTVVSSDTLSGTDTSYLWDGRTDHNQWETVSLQYLVTQITGTTTCTMIVQGSNDATTALNGTWVTLENYTTNAVGLVDTGTVKNTTYVFQAPSCQFKALRVRAITGGTQTSTFTGTYYLAAKFIGLIN